VEQVFLGVPAGSSNYTPPHLRAVKIMRINKLAALFIIAIIISPNLTIVRGQTLTLVPFDAEYEPGDGVSVSGTAAADANLSLIVVFSSTTLHEANFTAESDGSYTEEYEIPGDAADGVYTVTVSDGGESAEADFTVSSDDSEILAETLIEQAEEAQDNVEDAFDELEDAEIPAEANSSYLQGLEYLEMAEEDFDAGNYTEAAENAYEAIQLFGDAFERVQDLTPVEPDYDDDGNNETSNAERLAVAIERAYVYWGRINETVTRLGDEGFNVTNVEEALAEAKIHLDMAAAYQEEGNHTAAVRAFRAARTTMGRIHGYIESKIKERKEKQTEQFMVQFQRQVGKVTDVLEGLQESLEAGKTQRVRAVLEATARKLLRLSDRLGGEDIEDILDEVEDAVNELDDGIDELNGEGLSRQIKYANRFEAKMESLNRTLQRYAEAGYDTDELDEYMAEANGLLARIQAKVRAGNDEEAEALIEEAEDLIEEVGRYFKGYQKEVKKAQRGEENSLKRHERSGQDDDDDEDEDDTNGRNGRGSPSSSGSQGFSAAEDPFTELEALRSKVVEELDELPSTSPNVTNVRRMIEESDALIEEARALIEEDPDGAKELMDAAEELLDEAMDLVDDILDAEDNGHAEGSGSDEGLSGSNDSSGGSDDDDSHDDDDEPGDNGHDDPDDDHDPSGDDHEVPHEEDT